MQNRNIYTNSDSAKGGVSSGSALFAKINTLLAMVDYKKFI